MRHEPYGRCVYVPSFTVVLAVWHASWCSLLVIHVTGQHTKGYRVALYARKDGLLSPFKTRFLLNNT
jgi:hypothetical protein